MRSSALGLVVALTLLAACGGATGPTLQVDDDEWFVSAAPVEGDWYPGDNVRCLVRGIDGTLVGRLRDPGEASVWTRDAEGAFVEHECDVRSVGDGLETRFRSELTTLVEGEQRRHSPIGGLHQPSRSDVVHPIAFYRSALYEPEPLPSFAPRPPIQWPDADPPAEGTSLFGWAPADHIVIRVRSVDTAYRLANLGDRLASRLLGDGAGGAHDEGTLRMALHHLALPTIWATNPGGEKGVSECAIVLPPAPARGHLRPLALLRVTDPELHHQHVQAGLALEAQPDHLWRPDDDPFPERRERRNARRVLGDVEVVATDESTLQATLGESARWSEHAAMSEVAPYLVERSTALVALVPDRASSWLRIGGLDHQGQSRLSDAWCGRERPSVWGNGPSERELPPVRWIVVTTDAEGLAVTISCRTTDAADQIARDVRETGVSADVASDACRGNAARLIPLGLVERNAADVAERCFVWLGWKPVCPNDGVYRFHPITGEPSCTVHGTIAEPKEGADLPPLPISDVAVDGSRVTFRWAIDWRRRE